jgi:hypothetical protein
LVGLIGFRVREERRYGDEESKPVDLEVQLRVAIAAKDWPRVTELSGKLAGDKRTPTG